MTAVNIPAGGVEKDPVLDPAEVERFEVAVANLPDGSAEVRSAIKKSLLGGVPVVVGDIKKIIEKFRT